MMSVELFSILSETLRALPLKGSTLEIFVLNIFVVYLTLSNTKHYSIAFQLSRPVLPNLLGNIFLYCPVVTAIRRINSFNIDLPGRS